MEKQKFDIAIIGGGPGGYVAAIRAAQHHKKVALIEKKELGGTCLNRGCIPTKALIANTEVLRKIKKSKDFGIQIKDFSIDFPQMKNRKDQVVLKVRTSLEKLIADNKIQVFYGHGSFISPNEIKVLAATPTIINADKIIIATGSEPRYLPSLPFDYKKIHDSTSILELTDLPKKMTIIGGGVIGCEFASFYAELGVEVSIVELLPRILTTESVEVSDFMTASFKKRGIRIFTSTQVQNYENNNSELILHLTNGETLESQCVLVGVGRKYNTDEITIDKALVQVQPNGTIATNAHMQTNMPHIYAIGDITGKWLLAHVASHQGLVAIDHACGFPALMHYEAVPSVIFTHPEVASVGLTLEKAKERGFDAKTGTFPFQALGKSLAIMETEGFAQIVISKKTGQILGAQVIGYGAATLIAEMTVAIQNELTIESIQETIHAHPTISESWLEAAFLATDIPIHYPPKKTRA